MTAGSGGDAPDVDAGPWRVRASERDCVQNGCGLPAHPTLVTHDSLAPMCAPCIVEWIGSEQKARYIVQKLARMDVDLRDVLPADLQAEQEADLLIDLDALIADTGVDSPD